MVRNLLVAMGAIGALGMGTSGRTGDASVPQQPAVPTDYLPTAAGGALEEAHSWITMDSQMTTTPVIPTGGQISFRTKTRNGIRGTVNSSVVTCLETGSIRSTKPCSPPREVERVILPLSTLIESNKMGWSVHSSPS